MPRRLLSAAAAGALLLGIAACGDQTDEPVTTAPPSIDVAGPSDDGGDSSPSDGGGSEATEPTAQAPDIPPPDPADFAGMDEHTEEGAEQAFRYYIAVSVWAHQTGDTGPLSELESEGCGGCNYLNGDIPESQEANLLWTKSNTTEVEISSTEAPNYEYEVRYKFILGPHSRGDSSHSEYIDVPKLQYDAVGGMIWTSGHWKVSGLSIEWGEDVH